MSMFFPVLSLIAGKEGKEEAREGGTKKERKKVTTLATHQLPPPVFIDHQMRPPRPGITHLGECVMFMAF